MSGWDGWMDLCGGADPMCRNVRIDPYVFVSTCIYTWMRTHTSTCASVQGGLPGGLLRPSSSAEEERPAPLAHGATKEVTHRDLPSLVRGSTTGSPALPTSNLYAALSGSDSEDEDEDEDGATDAGETARARAEPCRSHCHDGRQVPNPGPRGKSRT